MELDAIRGEAALRAAGLALDGPRDSLERIARRNQTTPMAVYEILRRHPKQPEPVNQSPRSLTPEEVEAKYAGTGLGRKRIAEIASTIGIPEQTVAERLARVGIEFKADENFRTIANRAGVAPIDLMKIILAND